MNLRGQQNENNIIFYRNDELVIRVDKKSLLEKSAYFQTMFKSCYKHHNSDSIDVYLTENEKTVVKVMQPT